MSTNLTSTAPMGRRQVLKSLAVAGGAIALQPAAAFGQARRPIIGGVIQQARATNINWSNFQSAMAALGWVDGQNITFEWRFADGDASRIPALIQEVLRLQPSAIYSNNTGARAAKQLTATIPIVTAGLGTDDVALELLGPDFTKPAFNVIGPLNAPPPVPIAVAQRTAILKEALPDAKRIAYMFNVSGTDGGAAARADAQASALVARVTPVIIEVKSLADLPQAFQTLAREQVDAMATHPFTWQDVREPVIASRVPTTAAVRDGVVQGAFAGLYTVASTESADRGQRLAASYMDRVLKGAKVSDLRPERLPADEYKLAVNLATARSLGIKLPDSILARAEKIG